MGRKKVLALNKLSLDDLKNSFLELFHLKFEGNDNALFEKGPAAYT